MSELFAVIETGAKQYRVQSGDLIKVEKLDTTEAGEEVSFDRVLLVSGNGEIKVGNPIINNAKVLGKYVKETKAEKLIAFKYTRRKNYRRKIGHRQKHSLVKIESVQVN
ncbi:MAG: 50S ribosomal protein L21 [Chlamydiae bacterium]|nr:50S ribosomal protein L21 [Chlamydiota bacterium]MBI3276432.1 50S ribosomal protein L21 [Chlamydiota bacterium]